jgi:hypothetical protein
VAIVVLLAACGSGGSSRASAVRVVTDAVHNSETARMRGTIRVDGTNPRNIEIEGYASPVGTELHATVHDSAGTHSVETRAIGGVAYSTDASTLFPGEALPPGKRWARGDRSSVSRRLSSPDARGVLALLAQHASVQRDGTENLDGVPTTRYRAVEEPSKAAKSEVPGLRPSVLEIWVDAQGRMRRMRQTGGDPGFSVIATMDYFPLNRPVPKITAPPSDEVATERELITDVPTPPSDAPPPGGPFSSTPPPTTAPTQVPAP